MKNLKKGPTKSAFICDHEGLGGDGKGGKRGFPKISFEFIEVHLSLN